MKQKIQVIDADYRIEDDEVTVRCFGKSEGGENVLFTDSDFLPYVYAVPVEGSGIDELKQEILESDFEEEGEPLPVRKVEETEMLDGNEEKEVLKVYSSIPAKIPKLKNKLWDIEKIRECREFDIPFYKRYLIDKGIKPGSWIKVEGEEAESEDFDVRLEAEEIQIGIDSEKEIDWNTVAFDLEVYQDRIIMASVYSESYQKVFTTEEIDRDFVETVESEREIIVKLIDLVRNKDVDILLGYNTDEYDFDVLRERSDEYGLELSMGRDGERMKFNRRGRFSGARLKGRMHLDLYPFISHVLSPGLDSETLDLDSVANEMLDENKNDLTWEEMKSAWKNKEDLDVFADYALKDSELAYRLGREIAPQILELSKITGLIPFDACRLTYGQLTENYLLREAHERDMLAKNRPSRDKRRNRRRQGAYSGGFVYTPEPGLYENIAVFDFKSLYPTVMVAHNISPDTLNLEECDDRFELEEFEYDFCQDFQGFFPELVEELVQDRSKLKEEMKELDKDSSGYQNLDNRQQAEKILANSVGPDTHLVLRDPEGELCVLSVEEFYELIQSEEKVVNGSKCKEVGGWKALSVEDDEAVFKQVYAATRHNPGDAYKIRTRMGSVTVTGDHSIISMEGEASNRIRDSEFDGLEEVKGSEISKEKVVAQVSDFELGSSSQEVVVPEVLKNCPENFYLYIPKSENLEKRDWYGRRVDVIDAVIEGRNSDEINSDPGFGDKILRKAINEGLVEKKQIIGHRGNTYECQVTEKGEKYRDFYNTFNEREKNSRHYLISLEDLDVLPPREMLENSFVANKSGRARNKVPATLELTEDFASLLGWFVAEGHVRKDGTEDTSYMELGIASNNPEQRKEVQELLKSVFGYDASINGRQVTCCTSTIARIFSELCGNKADQKKVPKPIFNCQKNIRESFLNSYSLGDGDEDGRRFSTISKELQAGLSALIKEEDCILHNGYDTGTYRFSRRNKTQGEKIVSGDLYGQKPVEVKESDKPEKVYDISVKDTEKFVTAEGLVLHNSFYGYLGYNGARWYSRESAEATTYLGREYIQDTIELAEEEGFEIVYGDTDSVFIKAENIREKMDSFLEKVNNELPEFMKLEFEGFFERGFFTSTDSGEGAKKKYALIDEEGGMKITGFEQVRRDWSPIAKKTQKEVLRQVLENNVDGAVETAKQVIEELREGEVPVEDLRIYTTLNKKPENYDSTAPHVEAAKRAIERGTSISPGSTISYVITRGGGGISQRAEILSYAESYDADYYIENQVLPAVMRVLKVFGYTDGQLKGEGKQSGLGEF